MPPPIATARARKVGHGSGGRRAADEGVPPGGGPLPPPRLLPVARDAVAGITKGLFKARYKSPIDHAEGGQTMATCEETRTKISGMALRLSVQQCVEQSLSSPDHDVAALVMRQPVGMQGVAPGASAPQRLTREAVWDDNKAHFKQPKTAPEQLQEEKPAPNFAHQSGLQFKETTAGADEERPGEQASLEP